MSEPEWRSCGVNRSQNHICTVWWCEQTATHEICFPEGKTDVYCRQHWREELEKDRPPTFELAQVTCEPGGWAAEITPSPEEIEAAERRWVRRAYSLSLYTEDYIEHQCGGCRYFAATGSDFGICWNEKSPLDGQLSWEHAGCEYHSERSGDEPETGADPNPV